MPLSAAFLLSVCVAVAAKSAAWLWQLRTRNAGMVDAIWALTLAAIALLYALAGDAPAGLRALLGVMGAGWGLRLGWHLWRRNHNRPEDWRYARLRARWGAHADRNLFGFFQFQNLFTLALSVTAFAPIAYRTQLPAPAALGLGVALWLAAIGGEALADRQMERFRAVAANRGRVCREGLWRYSRHPNYFFECLHWVAYVPLALGAPWGWLSLLAPALMALLVLRVSGAPLLEAEMRKRKPGYAEYQRKTSALLPWPPKP